MPNELHQNVYRILDANANRAGEGLRTLEEYARFILDDGWQSAEIKSLRHELTVAMGLLDRESLLLHRDTSADVGTEIGLDTEYSRTDLAGVIAAAAARTQQSLRVLEEYTKTINGEAAKQIEQVRYRCYSVAAQLELSATKNSRQAKLADAQLYVLIDAGESDDAFCETVRILSAGGVDILQLRDREQSDRLLFDRALVGSRIAAQNDTLFIVNDRPDLAAAAATDGVHIGQDELPAAAARSIVGPNRLVGVSTHNINQVHQAITDGADYIGCGPVFAGTTKTFDEYAGPEFLKQVHDEPKQRSLPAFAIGGITAGNVQQVTATGFHRIAVTGAIRDATDKAAAIESLKKMLA